MGKEVSFLILFLPIAYLIRIYAMANDVNAWDAHGFAHDEYA